MGKLQLVTYESAKRIKDEERKASQTAKRRSRNRAKWVKVLEGGLLSQSEINALCSHFNGSRNGALPELHDDFYDKMPGDGYELTESQKATGIKYLRSKCFRQNGEERNSKFTAGLGWREMSAIKNFVDFKLVGVHEMQGEYGNYNTLHKTYRPVYRVLSSCGHSFDYVAEQWASTLLIVG